MGGVKFIARRTMGLGIHGGFGSREDGQGSVPGYGVKVRLGSIHVGRCMGPFHLFLRCIQCCNSCEKTLVL